MKKEVQLHYSEYPQPKTVAIIGGGWYGSHIAAALARRGYVVTLFESQDAIFSGLSGKFGVRIHVGPHYPRSRSTRRTCQSGFNEFMQMYPELVNEQEYAVYALGREDAQGQPSKVSVETFEAVCQEFNYKGCVDIQASGYNPNEILVAYDFREPSAVLGPRLRAFFQKHLFDVGVDVRCNERITSLTKKNGQIRVAGNRISERFDHVINTTSYKALLPDTRPLPFNMEIVYQPCLALIYRDKSPGEQPISFIVMDGWYPCLMPYDDRESTDTPTEKYIMTHGKWTIMSSYADLESAKKAMAVIDDNFIVKHVQSPSEEHMLTFWPKFSERFEYIGWSGEVLAKLKTQKEFRSGFSLQCCKTGVVSVFPGKITNIFDAERDVLALITQQDVLRTDTGYAYVKDSILHHARDEVQDKPVGDGRSTAELQTFRVELDLLTGERMPQSRANEDFQDKSIVVRNGVSPFSSVFNSIFSSARIVLDFYCEQSTGRKASMTCCVLLAAYGLYRSTTRTSSTVPGLLNCGIFRPTAQSAQIANSSNNYIWQKLRM